MNRRLAILAVVGAAVLFGSTGTAQALGPASSTPLGVGAVRILVGSAALWALAGRVPDLLRFRAHGADIAIGAGGVAVYQPGFFVGTERSGVALGTIIAIASAPIFAGGLQWGWLGRRPSVIWAWSTLLTIVGGVVVVFGRDASAQLSLVGTVASLSAGLGYALFALVTKRLIDRGLGSTEALAWQFSVGALLLMPLLFTQPIAWLATASGLALAAHLGLLATGLAYLLYGWGLRSIPTSTAVTLTLIEPVTAAIAAVWVLNEDMQWFGWLGAGVVIVGLALVGQDRPQT